MPAGMSDAAPERKRLNVIAQSERHSGDCIAMPYKVRHTTVLTQQRQSAPTVSDMLRFWNISKKGDGIWDSLQQDGDRAGILGIGARHSHPESSARLPCGKAVKGRTLASPPE